MIKILTLLFLVSCGTNNKEETKRATNKMELQDGKSYKIVINNDNVEAITSKSLSSLENEFKNNEIKDLKDKILNDNDFQHIFKKDMTLKNKILEAKNIDELLILTIPHIRDGVSKIVIEELKGTNIKIEGKNIYITKKSQNSEGELVLSTEQGKLIDNLNALMNDKTSSYKFKDGHFYYNNYLFELKEQ